MKQVFYFDGKIKTPCDDDTSRAVTEPTFPIRCANDSTSQRERQNKDVQNMNEITLFLYKTTKAEFEKWFMNEYAAIMQTFSEKPTILFETFEFEKREALKVRIIHSGAANSPTVTDLLKAIAQDFPADIDIIDFSMSDEEREKMRRAKPAMTALEHLKNGDNVAYGALADMLGKKSLKAFIEQSIKAMDARIEKQASESPAQLSQTDVIVKYIADFMQNKGRNFEITSAAQGRRLEFNPPELKNQRCCISAYEWQGDEKREPLGEVIEFNFFEDAISNKVKIRAACYSDNPILIQYFDALEKSIIEFFPYVSMDTPTATAADEDTAQDDDNAKDVIVDDEVILDNLQRGLAPKFAAKTLGVEVKTIYNKEAVLRKKLGSEKAPFRQTWRTRKKGTKKKK